MTSKIYTDFHKHEIVILSDSRLEYKRWTDMPYLYLWSMAVTNPKEMIGVWRFSTRVWEV